ncbi:MAG: pirin family protein [Poseidonibacter sp.]|uniref:pirin family protein n=1 Tax=Poseidonibacter sp. TaxID=2321188 RepID=UPI00359CE665
MLKKLPKENMGTSNLGWLQSRFHFSFAEYRNPENINFGVLRVLNDDIIHANSGFDLHPHSNMEIISYIVNGEISHKDSMGNEEVLKAGEVQYLSAGDGIYHSEHNKSNKDLRLLQIWIVPPKQSLPRLYGSYKYTPSQKENKLLKIVSSLEGDSKVRIYQDVNIYVSQLEKAKSLDFKIEKNRQVYFVQIEGSSFVNSLELKDSDAMQIVKEENLHIEAISNSHFLFIEMNEQ